MRNKHYPNYPDDADYTTNAPSYYDDLARKQKLIKLLAEKIWEYDERLNQRIEDLENVLQDYLSQWDNRIENLDAEVSHIFVEWLNDGTLEQIINHDVLGNKADQSELDKKIYYANTVDDMKKLDVKDGGYVETVGYWNVNDGGGASYSITNSDLTDDNGSVITLNNGLKALLLNDGVDCSMFGASKSKELSENEVNTIFDNWTTYVNNTPHKYFLVKERSYHIYKPLYIRKSFIGVGLPSFLLRPEGIGKIVSTDTTKDGKFSFNVQAVMGVHPFHVDDTQERFTLQNFKLVCTNQDNDTGVSQDIGLYFPQGNGFKMDNIVVIRPDEAGFVLKENWMAEMTRLNSWKSRGTGFDMRGIFTSLTFKNNYAHGFKYRGFDINGAVYSTIQDLGADSTIGKADSCYSFQSCWGTTIQSLGAEVVSVHNLIYVGDLVGNISNVWTSDVTVSNAIVHVFSDSQGVIENFYIRNSKREANTTPKSFLVTSITDGSNMNIEIRNRKTSIDLGDYTALRSIMIPKGRIVFKTLDNQDIYLNNNLGESNELVKKQMITGGYVKFYSDGEFELYSKYNGSQVSITTNDGSMFSSTDIEWILPTLDFTPIEINFFDVVDRSPSNTFTIIRQSVGISSPALFRIVSTTSRDLTPSLNVFVKGRWK